VLLLNHLGWNLTASVLALAAPTASFAFLAYQFTASSGFHLYLLGGGALGFALYRTDQWLVRGVMITVCGAVAIAAQMWWDDPMPRAPVPAGFVTVLFAVNVGVIVSLFYVLARFNHRYYVRERDRNALLLESAQVAAQTDALTDVYNRRGIAPILSSVARRGEYALALVDLDRFKRINDRLGHGAGDVVLANAARTLVRSVGDIGTVARWGGEEFLVVLPGLSLVEADEVMERVRAEIEDEYGATDSLARVTISVGLAHAPRYAGQEEVLRLADANLYEAKSAGRNVVISARLTEDST
jgi:diguanylate cyclase (GGDEF)-like protein